MLKKYGEGSMYFYAISETNKVITGERIYWRNPNTFTPDKKHRNKYITYILSFYDINGNKLNSIKVGKAKIGSTRFQNLSNKNRVPSSYYIVIEYAISFTDEEFALSAEGDLRYYFRRYKGGEKDGMDYTKNVTFNDEDKKDPMFNSLIRSNFSKMFAAKY